ncbi:leucine-rich repeat-containing protein 49 isoform X4 [Etheostoma spectabile]|uniref:leucine-rich repeat-containing protein 49 isoform X4 n=1 Tax=Etheostoma spectabile TaxID=54343 RepID=UPI0013AF7755|nr:leucine-rich repeat-containing protein 49 isoform X4 [Etheostoma spectabile]
MELTESKTMRSQKHNSVNDRWVCLTPMVNSCKLHLTTDKSIERAQRMTDSQDIVNEKNTNTGQTINHSNPENRLHACRRLAQTPLVPSFARYSTDSPVHYLVPLACGAQSGLDAVSHVTQDASNKSRRPTNGAGATYYRNALNIAKQSGGSGGYKYNAVPGIPFTRLPCDSFASTVQQIDLDRRCLEECPQLGPMDELQLLNLQHNLITRIHHLSHLQQLVFLNLYDNHISEMTGIEYLSSLRILMLGKNRIHKICCLESLSNLTILDLHDNQTEVYRLPCLQRLFLSCNNITSFDQLACLGESHSLSELTLDGNPVALETWYKQAVLRCVLHLRQLDMKRITDEDRRMAGVQARKEEEKKRESHKQTIHKEKRRLAIRNAAQQWEGVRSCLELPPANGAKEEVSPESSPAHSPAQTNGLAQEPSPDEPRRVSPGSGPERPSGGTESRLRTNSRPNSPRDPKLVEAGSGSIQSLSLSDSHLAELDGDTLRLFGTGALEALERGWGVQTAGAVTVITFRYINFDAIVPTLPRIRIKFPNLSHLIFLETNISRLPQLAALTQVRRLDQLTIHPEGNPVVSLALWRSFLIYRLHHFNLQKINGQEVTMNDVIAAVRVFGTLGHIAATETPRCRLLLLLEESRKRQLQFLLEGRGRRAGLSPEELRDNGKLLGEGLSRALFNYPSRDCSAESPEEGTVESSERAAMIEQYLQELVQRASDTNLKGEALHKLWPSMFAEMVRDCVLEMRDRAAFRQASLARISETK